jgi:hypothetical protein
MHYNTNPQLTSESYVYPSMIITIISWHVFVYHSNGTGTRYLRNHNVREMCGILAHPALLSLFFLMYHRSLHIHKFRNHNIWRMCGILAYPHILLLLFVIYHRQLVAYQYI